MAEEEKVRIESENSDSGMEANTEETFAEGSVSETEKALRAELEELKDKYLRLLAEFDNFKKRQAKLQQESFEAFGDIIFCGILEILDNFERALASGSDHEGFRKGVELIYKQLKDLLSSYGVEEMSCKGKPFDPLEHEAISTVASEDEGKIVEVLQKGYKRRGRVIRPSRVVVGVKEKETGNNK